MPRKRRQPKRRIDELTPALVELLILGSSEIDPFLEFDVTAEEIAAAWQQHGTALKAEAARRGIVVAAIDKEN